MSITTATASEDLSRNPRLFLLFRIFFNCRFYYPVFAILFLDFGLSEEQFAYLNAFWAVAIVLLEVPSGALADQFGRKTLVVSASVLMVIEMLVMCLMPVIGADAAPDEKKAAIALLFAVFAINRVISGAAEAAASGADEALAYDSLAERGRDQAWNALMSRLMRWQSAAFIIAMLVGAAVYDPELVNRALGWIGINSSFTQTQTLKFPIYCTLGMAVCTLLVALRMKEPPNVSPDGDPNLSLKESIRKSYRRTLATGTWIIHTPAALMLILFGLFYDSIIRLYYTVNSIYFRTLGFEERYFGVIAVAGSIIGIFAASLGEKLIKHRSPTFNFALIAALGFAGILSLAFPIPYWGVALLVPLWLGMRLLHLFLSNYLNRVASSDRRATVLSFRGLTMNLAYFTMTMLYGLQTRYIRDGGTIPESENLSEHVFTEAISWWWIYFLIGTATIYAFQFLRMKQSLNRLIPAEKE